MFGCDFHCVLFKKRKMLCYYIFSKLFNSTPESLIHVWMPICFPNEYKTFLQHTSRSICDWPENNHNEIWIQYKITRKRDQTQWWKWNQNNGNSHLLLKQYFWHFTSLDNNMHTSCVHFFGAIKFCCNLISFRCRFWWNLNPKKTPFLNLNRWKFQ